MRPETHVRVFLFMSVLFSSSLLPLNQAYTVLESSMSTLSLHIVTAFTMRRGECHGHPGVS